MRTTHFKALGCLFVALCFISSCQLDEFENVEGVSYEAEFAVPLVNTAVTIQDFLDRSSNDLSFLTIENDGSFTLSYQEEINALNGKDALEDIQGDFPLPVPNKNTILPLSALEEVNITSANFKSGQISFGMSSMLTEDLDVTITFPGIFNNGQALELTAKIEYDGSSPSEASTAVVDLSGYSLNTMNGDLIIQYEAVNGSNQSRNIDFILGDAQNWAFDNIAGDWIQQEFFSESDTVEIDLYNNQVEGELFLSDPKLGITINNSFGVPVLVSLNNIKVLTNEGNILTFTSADLNAGLLAAAPSMNQQGESMESIYWIDRTNSNIDLIFNSKPVQIWYDVALKIAPGNIPTEGFIMEASDLDVTITFELPISGTAKGFTVEEIVELDLGEEEEEGVPLKEAQLKLITANAIPIDAGLQLYFLNTAGQKIDSMFNGVSEVLKSNSPEVVTFFDLTPERLESIRSAKNILIRSEFSTTNNGGTNVTIKNDQELSVKLGLRATLAN